MRKARLVETHGEDKDGQTHHRRGNLFFVECHGSHSSGKYGERLVGLQPAMGMHLKAHIDRQRIAVVRY